MIESVKQRSAFRRIGDGRIALARNVLRYAGCSVVNDRRLGCLAQCRSSLLYTVRRAGEDAKSWVAGVDGWDPPPPCFCAKYYKQVQEGTNVVLIAPDLLDTFPDSEAVNEALRSLKQIAEQTRKRAS